MPWYKSWIDTRWRFLIALVLLFVFACGAVVSYSRVQELALAVSPPVLGANDELRAELQAQLEIMKTFGGYIWSQWFLANFPKLLTIVAALLGSGSPLMSSGSGALFSLALPVSRARWIGTRAGTGLAELLLLALVPSVAVSALAPLVGQQFSLGDAFIYGACELIGASVFFAVAVFLSTLFNDVWRPLLFTCLAALAVGMVGYVLPEGHGVFAAMAGGSYFAEGSLPWVDLFLCAAAAAALVYASAANVQRRDF